MSLPESLFYVGVDWAAETHALFVFDAAGKVHARFTIAQTADGFADLVVPVSPNAIKTWQDHTPYNPQRQGNAVSFNQPLAA